MFFLWIKSLKWLPMRMARSLRALAKLFYFKPQYTFLAAAVSIIFYEFIFWLLNLGLAQYLLTTPYLSLFDKVDLIVGSYAGIFAQPFSSLALMLFAISVLQGMAVASLVYLVRSERTMNKGVLKEVGGTGVAGLFSVLGLGCAACGTSLVTPLLTFFFVSSSVAIAEVVGFYSAVIALIAALITVHLVGLRLSHKLNL